MCIVRENLLCLLALRKKRSLAPGKRKFASILKRWNKISKSFADLLIEPVPFHLLSSIAALKQTLWALSRDISQSGMHDIDYSFSTVFCKKSSVIFSELMGPVLKIYFGPPTAESKNLKNHVNFGVGDLFFRSPALWSSQNVFGPPTAGRVVVDIKDRANPPQPVYCPVSVLLPPLVPFLKLFQCTCLIWRE